MTEETDKYKAHIVVNPIYVCQIELFPNHPGATVISLQKWPSLRWRFFVWLFFGIRVEQI